MADVSDSIEDLATAPATMASDGQTVTERPVGELVEADQYLAGKAAVAGTNPNGGARSGWNLLRPARVIPPGAAR